jgi:hypothetical protein
LEFIAGPGREQGAQVVDHVGLAGVLVRPVALHAGKAERDAAGVARRGLHAVECDLDDELGADEHGDPAAAGLAREQLLRLPRQELVRQPLEALPDHDEVVRARVAGAEVEVRPGAVGRASSTKSSLSPLSRRT